LRDVNNRYDGDINNNGEFSNAHKHAEQKHTEQKQSYGLTRDGDINNNIELSDGHKHSEHKHKHSEHKQKHSEQKQSEHKHSEQKQSEQKQKHSEQKQSENKQIVDSVSDGLTQIDEDDKPQNANSIFLGAKFDSGYLPVGDHGGEMFYIFINHQNEQLEVNDDQRTPVVLWLTGGPGCASEVAIVKENGPIWLEDDGTSKANDHSWTKVAHMLYVDQPLGTGFSQIEDWMNYADGEELVTSYLRDFLLRFFEKNSWLNGNPFFITGESYAGHFIPKLALSLVNQPLDGVNFSGVALGNAWVQPLAQFDSLLDFAIDNNMIDNIDIESVRQLMSSCRELILNHRDVVAMTECSLGLKQLIGDRNVYDIRLPCESPPLCYPFFTVMETFFDRTDVQQTLNTKMSTKWLTCDVTVRMFLMTDWMKDYQSVVASLLDANLPVLVYNGDQDFICNWMGSLEWTNGLQWGGGHRYRQQHMSEWPAQSTSSSAGQIKQSGPLTFLRLYDAGHMSPMDQPAVLLEMLRQFTDLSIFESSTEDKLFIF